MQRKQHGGGCFVGGSAAREGRRVGRASEAWALTRTEHTDQLTALVAAGARCGRRLAVNPIHQSIRFISQSESPAPGPRGKCAPPRDGKGRPACAFGCVGCGGGADRDLAVRRGGGPPVPPAAVASAWPG